MLELLDDVVDDIQAIHRVDDPLALPSSRFFQHARRLPVRGGAVAHALASAPEVDEGRQTQPATEHDVTVLEGTPDDIAAIAAMSQHPGFPGIGYSGG